MSQKTRRLRNRSNIKRNVNEISDESEDNNNSESDIDFNGNEEQMSDSSEEFAKPKKKPSNLDSDTVSTETHFECPNIECKKELKTNRQIVEHLKKVHKQMDEKPTCHWKGCSKVFLNQRLVSRHIIVSHTSNLVCDWKDCQYRTYDSSNLKIHKRSDSDERPFKCLINDRNKLLKCSASLNVD